MVKLLLQYRLPPVVMCGVHHIGEIQKTQFLFCLFAITCNVLHRHGTDLIASSTLWGILHLCLRQAAPLIDACLKCGKNTKLLSYFSTTTEATKFWNFPLVLQKKTPDFNFLGTNY